MAAGASYPANISTPGPDDDPGSRVAFDGFVNFTDDTDQPAPGDVPFLPTGWTEDDSDPANVSGGAGSLGFDDGTVASQFNQNGMSLTQDAGDAFLNTALDGGVQSGPAATACFTAANDGGATVALNSGGLPIVNLPSADPHIAGALWNDGGSPAISTG